MPNLYDFSILPPKNWALVFKGEQSLPLFIKINEFLPPLQGTTLSPLNSKSVTFQRNVELFVRYPSNCGHLSHTVDLPLFRPPPLGNVLKRFSLSRSFSEARFPSPLPFFQTNRPTGSTTPFLSPSRSSFLFYKKPRKNPAHCFRQFFQLQAKKAFFRFEKHSQVHPLDKWRKNSK